MAQVATAIPSATARAPASAADAGGGRRSLPIPLLSATRPGGADHDGWQFPDAALSIWHSARAALWQGVHAVGLVPGDRVLAPAYCCGVEVATLLAAGLSVDYYRVRRDLAPDMEHLEELCRAPARGLLLIHYFGLPQPVAPIAAFARERGLILMEDCAHGLFGRNPDGSALGSRGDLAVFSLKKHLPVPNGGLLVLRDGGAHNRTSRRTAPGLRPTAKSLAYLAAVELEHRWPGLNDGLRRLLRRRGTQDIVGSGRGDPAEPLDAAEGAEPETFDPAAGAWGASRLSRQLYRRVDADAIRTRRARHYRTLLESVGDGHAARPLCPRLPEGASPWLFPLLTGTPTALRRHLLAGGVASIGFWRAGHPAIPRHLFPFEEHLRRHVVALPVHHGLSSAEVARIGELVQGYAQRA